MTTYRMKDGAFIDDYEWVSTLDWFADYDKPVELIKEVWVKAAIDGLVDAGVLPGDTPRHLRSLVQHAPVRGADALVLHLRGELREGILDD